MGNWKFEETSLLTLIKAYACTKFVRKPGGGNHWGTQTQQGGWYKNVYYLNRTCYVYTQKRNPEYIKPNTVIWKTAQRCKTADTWSPWLAKDLCTFISTMTHLADPDDKVSSCKHVHWQFVAYYLRTTTPVRTLTKKIWKQMFHYIKRY
jgi:hypothetical protein